MDEPELGIEDDLCMEAAMNGLIPIDLSQFELKEIPKLDDVQVLSSWKGLKDKVKEALDEKYGGIGEIESAMQPPCPTAADPVNKISNPHLIQYKLNGRTENFVCTWGVYYGGNASDEVKDPGLYGMKDVKLYEDENEKLKRSKMTEEEEARYDEWKEKCRMDRDFDRRLEAARKRKEERKRREREEEYVPLTDFVEEQPKPDKPLIAKNGKKPKVGLLVLSDFRSWAREYIIQEKPRVGFGPNPLAKLVQRIVYLYRLFEGCDVELLLFGMAMPDLEKGIVLDHLTEIGGATTFKSTDQRELLGYFSKTKYDFGLMINIRQNGVDVGMGYGLEERHERELLRGFGLACRGNYLFGDWGYPGDHGTRMNGWNNLEFAGAYDSSAYMRIHLKVQVYKFAGDNSPHHSRPFARLVRLDRYIHPISDKEMKIRDEDIARIWGAVRGEYFSNANLWATWWCTFSGLLFARDFIYKSNLRWKCQCIQSIQEWVANKYVNFQYFYWNSFEQEWADLLFQTGEKVCTVLKKAFFLVCVIVVVFLIVGYAA